MTNNELPARLHLSNMDAFYQQQLHASHTLDRFPVPNYNPGLHFSGFSQNSYNSLISTRQSSNTLPSIGNFADPLSYLPYQSQGMDRGEPLPEISSIMSSGSDYSLAERQKKSNNEVLDNMATTYGSHFSQSSESDVHSSHDPRYSMSKSYTMSQLSQQIPAYTKYDETSTRGPCFSQSNPHISRETTHGTTVQASSVHITPKHFKTAALNNEAHPMHVTNNEGDRFSEIEKWPNKKRRALSYVKSVKKNKPFVSFHLMGKLEKRSSKKSVTIENCDIAVQTDKSLMINDFNLTKLKGGLHLASTSIPTKPADIEESNNAEKSTEVNEDLNNDPNPEAIQSQNDKNKNMVEQSFSRNLNHSDSLESEDGQNLEPKIEAEVSTSTSTSNIDQAITSTNLPKLTFPEIGNLTPSMINSLPIAAFKGKDKDAEMERMEINIRIDDSQYVAIDEDSPKRWKCNLCPKSYTTKHNLVTHVMDHNGIKPHLCMICGKYFKQLSHLNTHMLTHENTKPNICPICGKGFTQVSHVKRHQAVHNDNKPHVCDICSRGFAFPSELRIHKEKQHVNRNKKCPECDEVFSNSKELTQHLATHEQREDHECPECNKLFRYPSQLKDHLTSHSGHRPFICSECGMDFIKEHHLRAHQFTHTGLKPFECPQCNRAFNQRANMVRHQLIHKEDRSYKCDECDKTFTQPQTLKAHMIVHADKKPHKCHICGKEFGRQHNLQAHMHMHGDSKPFSCFCGSSFTLKGNLRRHKKVKHGINETTESMEEEAVSFLNNMSSRYHHGLSMKFSNYPQDECPDSESFSSDSKLQRKQRKSIPRKLPQQGLNTSVQEEEEVRKDEDEDGDESKNDDDDDNEIDDDDENEIDDNVNDVYQQSKYFSNYRLTHSDLRMRNRTSLTLKRSYDQLDDGEREQEDNSDNDKYSNEGSVNEDNENDDMGDNDDDEEEEEDKERQSAVIKSQTLLQKLSTYKRKRKSYH